MGWHTIRVAAADRSPGDCFRMAVVIAYGPRYGFEYPETPATHPDEPTWQADWQAWATERGWWWWQSNDLAPIFLDRWIAAVPSLRRPGVQHAVAMTRDRLLADSNKVHAYKRVLPADVQQAKALLRDEDRSLSGKYWRIGQASEHRPETA